MPIPAALALSLSLTFQGARTPQFTRLPDPFPGPTYWTEGVALADVDRDGDLDVFFARGEGWNEPGAKHGNALFVNRLEEGALRFEDESAARLGERESHAREVVIGDVQADGFDDALFANGFNTDIPFLYVNQGARGPGVFEMESEARGLTEVLSSASGAFGDLDDDGDLDLVLSHAGPSWAGLPGGTPRLYLNDGSGHFTDASEQLGAATKTTPMGVHLVDIDGDWDLDLFGPNKTGEHGLGHYLLLNDGEARFSDASELLPPTTGEVYEADVADLDGDTDLDLFFISLTKMPAPEGTRFPLGEGPVENLLQPEGELGFELGAALGVDDDNEVGFLDYDMDGDLDAFIASLGPAEKVHRNEGGMRFAIVPEVVAPVADPSLDLAIGDLDLDGDQDLVTAQALERIGAEQPPCAVYLNEGPRDTRAPRSVARRHDIHPRGDTWIVHAEVRDEWVDDGRDGVTAELDFVEFEARPAVVPVALGPDAPRVVRVSPGETVSWTNGGAASVELALEGALRGEALGELAPGASLSRCFVTPGVVEWRAGPNRGELVVVGDVQQARATRSGGGIWRFELARKDGTARLLRWQLRLRDAAGNERITTGGQLEFRGY